MTSTTIKNEIRTGIYVQESAGATTVGDGLAPRGDKSPVADTQTDDKLSINLDFPIVISDDSSVEDIAMREPNRMTRKQRYELMKNELLELSFPKEDITLMRSALNSARHQFHRERKMVRQCEEKQVDPETLQNSWIERKERELATFKAERAQKIADGLFNPLSFRERKEMKLQRKAMARQERENSKDGDNFEGPRREPLFVSPRLSRDKHILYRFAKMRRTNVKRNYRRFHIKVTLPNYSLTSPEVLTMIKKQNGLLTERWTLVEKKPWYSMFKATYAIDKFSLKKLHQKRNRIYILFEKVRIKICEDNDPDRIRRVLEDDSI